MEKERGGYTTKLLVLVHSLLTVCLRFSVHGTAGWLVVGWLVYINEKHR